jgi:retron-type reverse transcriptase
MSRYRLKVCVNSKGAGKFVREFSTSCIELSEDWLTNELKLLSFNSRKNSIAEVNINVNSLLSSPQFWIHCYKSIKSNTYRFSLQGSCQSNTSLFIDKFDSEYFNLLAKTISSGRFRFEPIRKTPITDTVGVSCASDIANNRDKIVQKGMAVLLEQVTNHRFTDSSFGFKRGKSAHDAITYIRQKVSSGMWTIESDICKCFDNFDHKRLVSLIRKKYVNHQVFSDLLYKAVNAKIISVSKLSGNMLETSQSSVVSSILFNIYLHEFDSYILESESLSKFRSGKQTLVNPAFLALFKLTESEKVKAQSIKISKGNKKYWEFLHKLRVFKLKEASILNIPRYKFKGINRKIVYVRYFKAFIIFVWGTKNDCLEIKNLVGNFLKSQLSLNILKAKMKITHLKKDKANFLGFQFWQSRSFIHPFNSDENTADKIDRKDKKSEYRAVINQVSRLRITFSMNSVLSELVDKGLVRYKAGRFFPTSFKSALQYSIPNIIQYLKFVFRDLATYYGFCHNWYDAKTLYNYFGKYCTAMTIAHKTKSKVTEVFRKYGSNLEAKDHNSRVICRYGSISNYLFSNKLVTSTTSNDSNFNVAVLLIKHRKLAEMSSSNVFTGF